MSKTIFLNLPVKDLAAATCFYEAMGCVRNEQFSDHQASSMVWSDTITFQLLATDYFASFTPKQVADAHAASEVLIAVSLDNREAVDTVVKAASASGGRADVREPMNMGWLYNRAFEDPDGHVFEAVYMDMEAASAQAPDQLIN